MKLRLAYSILALTVGYVVLFLIVALFGLNVRQFDGSWVDHGNHYSTDIPVGAKKTYCLCPAYVCETAKEAALIARPTVFGWRAFEFFRDPKREPHVNAQMQRQIYARGRAEFCIEKGRGDRLKVTLTPADRHLLLDIE